MISRELNRYDFESKVFLFKLTVLVEGYKAFCNQTQNLTYTNKQDLMFYLGKSGSYTCFSTSFGRTVL